MQRHNEAISDPGSALDPRGFGLIKAAYSVKDTIELLSIGRTTFYALVGRGDLKITKLGKKSLVYATDIHPAFRPTLTRQQSPISAEPQGQLCACPVRFTEGVASKRTHGPSS